MPQLFEMTFSINLFNNITQFFRARRHYLYKMYTMNSTEMWTDTHNYPFMQPFNIYYIQERTHSNWRG